MKLRHIAIGLLLVLTVVLAACGGGQEQAPAASAQSGPEPTAVMEEESSEVAMPEEGHDEAAMADEGHDESMMTDGGQDNAAMAQESHDDAAMADEGPDESMMADEGQDNDAMAGDSHDDSTAAAEDQGDAAMAGEAHDDMTMAGDKSQDESTMEQPATDLPAWFSAELTDVNSGQTFTIAGQQGRVVLVETLAVWCSNCLRQQKEVVKLHEALGERDDFVSVGIDIDLNESADQLRNHAGRNGFDWVYAVATRDVAREIGQLYGTNFLNPPSTPMLIVDRNGEAHPLPFGIKSAADLQNALEPFLSEAM